MRWVLGAVASLLLTPGWAQAAPVAHGRRAIAARQAAVVLLAPHRVSARPATRGRSLGVVAAVRPITGEQTVLPLLATTVDRAGHSWLRVRLPGRVLGHRPPPHVGWIEATRTRRASLAWYIVVLLDARRVMVYREGRLVRRYPAIVGKPSTPTPRGEYFVEESVALSSNQVGAPFALATSDRSHVLQDFDGGPGQIALHGLQNVGGTLGTAESHGCIRMADRDISWLAARIAPGTPVSIR